jgi:hypothetical protein
MEPEEPFGECFIENEIVNLNDDLKVEVEWVGCPYPIPEKASHLRIHVLDKNLTPTQLSLGDQFFIQADMGMGHGLASFGHFFSSDLSTWTNETLAFYMGGDYLMTLSLFDENFNQLGEAKWRVVF